MNETTEEILKRISSLISEPTGGKSEASFNFDDLSAGYGTEQSSHAQLINQARQVTPYGLIDAIDLSIEAGTTLPRTKDISLPPGLATLKRAEHFLRSRVRKDKAWTVGQLDLEEILQLRQATGQIASLLLRPLSELEPEPDELELDYSDLAEQSRLEFRPYADWSSAAISADLYEKLFSVQYELSDEE